MWLAFPFKYQSHKLKIVGFGPSWNGIPNQESYHVQIIDPGLIFHCSALFIPGGQIVTCAPSTAWFWHSKPSVAEV